MKKLIALVMSSLISSSIFVPSIIFANEKPSETPKKMEQIRECKRDKQCPCEDKKKEEKTQEEKNKRESTPIMEEKNRKESTSIIEEKKIEEKKEDKKEEEDKGIKKKPQ